MTKKILLAAMLSPLFLAGCKGGGSDPVTTDEPLSITCVEGSTTIQYAYSESGDHKEKPNLESSLDNKKWDKFDVAPATISAPTTITSLNKGQTVYFRGNNLNGFNGYTDTTNYEYFRFTFDNKEGLQLKISGNIMSLLSPKDYAKMKDIPNSYCFYRLFEKFGSVAQPTNGNVDASDLLLPATELKDHCYKNMFGPATGFGSPIYKAPKTLPATIAADNCYEEMFIRNEYLTTTPIICLETLSNFACSSMFQGCKTLNVVEGGGSVKFFTCPDTGTFSGPVYNMFIGTKNYKETGGTPTTNQSWYYNIA